MFNLLFVFKICYRECHYRDFTPELFQGICKIPQLSSVFMKFVNNHSRDFTKDEIRKEILISDRIFSNLLKFDITAVVKYQHST